MRINHNISSMFTQGALFKVNNRLGKNLEKLSTGLRINRASDDAAGLSVSEQLRTQIRGNAMAKRNVSDGIALLQIADGALNEMEDILHRMREIVVQASNDTLSQTERDYLFQEYDSIRDELTRINNTTTYNGMQVFASENDTAAGLHINPEDGAKGGSNQSLDYGDNVGGPQNTASDFTEFRFFNLQVGANFEQADADAKIGASPSAMYGGSAVNKLLLKLSRMDAANIAGIGDEAFRIDNDFDPTTGALSGFSYNNGSKSKFQAILQMLDGKQEEAYGWAANDTGFKRINNLRSHVGSLINRLEHTHSNLTNQEIRMQSAESQIRDTDYAMEMSDFTKNNIITQAASSMLVQSNMSTQSVLSLLA